MEANVNQMERAKMFIQECYEELGKNDEIESRIKQIQKEIYHTGTYLHTKDELEHGVRMAWRNSNRCIGRLFWNGLHVIDAREADCEEELFQALFDHIRFATNKGRIRPTITIFRQTIEGKGDIRIHNSQLISYAGYFKDGCYSGDPHMAEFTSRCEKWGWTGKGTDYDVLPILLSIGENIPDYKEIPEGIVKEVHIEHPELPIAELGLKWYAVPIVSSMRLEIGGFPTRQCPLTAGTPLLKLRAEIWPTKTDTMFFRDLPHLWIWIRGIMPPYGKTWPCLN